MFRKFSQINVNLQAPKLELQIMRAHKFGKINPMIQNRIYGHLDVLYMSFAHLNLLLKAKI